MNLDIFLNLLLPLLILVVVLYLFKNNMLNKLETAEQVAIYFIFLLFLIYEMRIYKNGINIINLILDFSFIGIFILLYLLLKESGLFRKLELVRRKEIENTRNSSIVNSTNLFQKENVRKPTIKKNKAHKKNTSIVNKLSEEQMILIFYFFEDEDILSENLSFNDFKEKFLKEPISLSTDIPTFREFYNYLKLRKEIKIPNIPAFLNAFINADKNKPFDYNQFTKDAKPISKLSDEIDQLFQKL